LFIRISGFNATKTTLAASVYVLKLNGACRTGSGKVTIFAGPVLTSIFTAVPSPSN
jgi:hypothetical protein